LIESVGVGKKKPVCAEERESQALEQKSKKKCGPGGSIVFTGEHNRTIDEGDAKS